jgi:hypothetical protein
MNIATTTGFPEQIIYNTYERIVFMIIIYIGNGLFLLGFGMMAASSKTLPEKYEKLFGTVR